MNIRSTFLVLALASAWSLAAREASANPGITGYSGKPYNGSSHTCLECHGGGGAPPTVDITIPTAMKAGQSADVTIVIKGSRVRTSMNAAFTTGVVATKISNTDIPFPLQTPDEIAAVVPPPDGATGTYKFSFVAPNKNGTITMYLAAMSANGSGTGGDGVAVTTRDITITGATSGGPTDGGAGDGGGPGPTGDGGGPGPTGDAGTGTGTGTDGGVRTTGDGGGASGPPADDGGTGASEGEDENSNTPQSGSVGGCSAAARGVDGSAFGLALVAALGLIASKRRRR